LVDSSTKRLKKLPVLEHRIVFRNQVHDVVSLLGLVFGRL